jgi:3-dehydroquinate synthase
MSRDKTLQSTADSHVLETITIQSHKGTYSLQFNERLLENADRLLEGEPHFLVDANVARLYADALRPILSHRHTILIDATEENKSIDRVIPVIERLVADNVRRNHVLVAIGGGIIQDITCFIASTLLRGLPWKFIPTTLLAQADSCIGSKSSINVGATKNMMGTFNPPNEIFVCTGFLDTLHENDMRSGVGEILKVHAIDGHAAFDRIAADYDELFRDRARLLAYVRQALLVKQRYIELDEFDRGVRNVFNYGHSFGHALEAATKFAIPHGVAVTMGMDMANRIAALRNLIPETHFRRMHRTLEKNYSAFAATRVAAEDLLGALMKDKKNSTTKLVLILPVGDEARIERVEVSPDSEFRTQCSTALERLRA